MSKRELRTASGEVIAVLPDDPPKAFIDLWDAAWTIAGVTYGKYDPENAPDPEHTFLGNKLYMTYQEALRVMADSFGRNILPYISGGWFAGCTARTFLPIFNRHVYGGTCAPNALFKGCKNLEVVALYGNAGEGSLLSIMKTYSGALQLFTGCQKLTKVLGGLEVANCSDFDGWDFFEACSNLTEIRIKNIGFSTTVFSRLPKIGIESVRYWVVNRYNTNELTWTMHKDVYNALCGDAPSYPFNGGSREEWTQLMADAMARQIAFTT